MNIFVLCLFMLIIGQSQAHYSPEEEYNITSSILNGYNKDIQPANLTIKLSLTLNQIVGIDEKNQIMTTTSIIDIIWNDTRLAFNPNLGLAEVLVPVKSIWLPDMYVVNTADTSGFFGYDSQNLANILPNGLVKVTVSLTNLRTRCKLNYYKFPYDSQSCQIKIGSWQHSSKRIDFDSDDGDIDLSNLFPNNIFKLIDVVVFDTVALSRFAPQQNATDVVYQFNLEREPRNYMINNVVPSFLIAGVNLLMFNFKFVSQCTISMTIFLTMAVYSVRISNEFPTQANYVPLVFVHFLMSSLYTFIALCWFVYKDYLERRKELPDYIMSLYSSATQCLSRGPKVESKPEPLQIEIEELAAKEELKKEPLKCNNCDFCEDCLAKKEKEKKTKKKAEEKVHIIRVLNRSAFFVLFFMYLITYLVIWILIVS